MNNIKIKLGSVEDAAQFVETIEKSNLKADINIGKYCLDARSLLGILTMDLKKPLCLNIYEDDDKAKELIRKLAAFCI